MLCATGPSGPSGVRRCFSSACSKSLCDTLVSFRLQISPLFGSRTAEHWEQKKIMEQNLLEAARTGNLNLLLRSMESDPTVLEIIVVNGGETPLHVASMYGHLSFVREIVKLRENLGRELNEDGLTPLHIAAAMGHTEIVRELLKELGGDVCLIKGKERRVPLHYAAMKGRVCVIDELVSANPSSLDEVTARGETALHVAAKYNQYDAFAALVEHLREFNKLGVLNTQDNCRNTVLHIAVQKRQYEVIDLLLGSRGSATIPRGLIEVNSMNSNGFTALDVLLQFGGEPGDPEIHEILHAAGAVRAKDLRQDGEVARSGSSTSQTRQDTTSEVPNHHKQWLDYFKYRKDRDSPNDVRTVLLVIAILIATATYQAALSPPGGVWQEDYYANGSCFTTNRECNNAVKSFYAGTTIIGSKSWLTYGGFIFLNSVGFFTSLELISLLTIGFPFRLELQVSIYAVALTYGFAMSALSPNLGLSVFFTVLSAVLPFIVSKVPNLIRNRFKEARSSTTMS